MIIRSAGDSLLLITQPDHASLSAVIMDAWRVDGLPEHPSRSLILYATREHDNGWIEPDAAPIVDLATGRPHDFISAPDAIKHGVWPRALARIGAREPLAAALIAHHALHVYRRHRGQADWQPFFDEIATTRKALLARAGVTDAGRARPGGGGAPPLRIEADYRFLFLGDLLSLIFCNGWTDVVDAEGYRIRLTGDTLEVTPDPFAGRTVALDVAVRRIPARHYRSDDDLREGLGRAPAETLRGAARGWPG